MAKTNKSDEQIYQARRANQTAHYAQAEEICRRILNREPYNTSALSVLSTALLNSGRIDAALETAALAARLAPHQIESQLAYGQALWRTGDAAQGRAIVEQSLRMKPQTRQDLISRGLAFITIGHPLEAIECFTLALRAEPADIYTLRQLEVASKSIGSLETVWQATQAALQAQPENPEILNTAARLLTARGHITEALAYHRRSLAIGDGTLADHASYLLALNYDPNVSNETLLQEHVRWAEKYAAGLMPTSPHPNEPSPTRRLKIGYVSADLRRHPVTAFMRGILAHHDPAELEIFVYSDVRLGDEITAALRTLVPHWQDIHGLPDAALADRIRHDQIDILVDLSGHSSISRLLAFARKPAPVQVTYLGYSATTGLSSMDYCLTDAFVDPESAERSFTEKLMRLPECFCCYWPPRDPKENSLDPTMSGDLPINPLPALRNGHITFGSFHALVKLNDSVLDLWSDVLRAIPDACLMLYRNTLHAAEQTHLSERFAARGITKERLQMVHEWPHGQHYLARYNEIDIHLDTFPWSGHTTTCEALWMGVPTITLLGDRHATRMSGTVLRAAGLEEFATHTREEFIEKAQHWAAHPQELATLRANLREQVANSPLCDAPKFIRQLETAYRNLWRTWCDTTRLTV